MVKIHGTFINAFTVELDINSFSEIWFENMSREDSDSLIRDAIHKKYGEVAEDIHVINEVRT